jgi:hypothetical protein
MSSGLTFPMPPGVQIEVGRTPIFKTSILESWSGKEQRTTWWNTPRWRYDLSFKLRQALTTFDSDSCGVTVGGTGTSVTITNLSAPNYVVPGDTLVQGANSSLITATAIGASTTVLTLATSRAWTTGAATITRDEVQALSGFFFFHRGSWNSFNFVDPVDGLTRECRFVEDEVTFERYLNGYYALKTCALISVK